MKRTRYSLHVIQSTGQPSPVDGKADQYKAIDAAEDKARATGLEVRVWDTKRARCIYSVPAAEETQC